MEGTRIVLVRHGESRAQELKVIGGHEGCTGLSDLGRAQVAALAQRLRRTGELADASALYSSIMPRAVETAAIIADAVGGHQVVQECDFCEHHPGAADGISWDEFERLYPAPSGTEVDDPDLRRIPGAETWNEMGARVARGLDTIVERHAGQTVVVACHGGVVVHSMIRWLDLSAQRTTRAWINPANSSLTEWRFAPNPFSDRALPLELVRFNDHAHLADLDGLAG